jgi:hypothetical protein
MRYTRGESCSTAQKVLPCVVSEQRRGELANMIKRNKKAVNKLRTYTAWF